MNEEDCVKPNSDVVKVEMENVVLIGFKFVIHEDYCIANLRIVSS